MPKNGSPMCSAFSKSAGEVATGSAPGFDRCLLIETPRPWAGNVETSITFPSPVMDTLDMAAKNGDDTKLLCVAPDDEYTERGHTTVMLFSRPEPQFATYDKHEYQVPREAVPSLVEALIRRNGGLDEFEAHRRDTSGVRDVLVCTHGSRDNCCATRGYPVYQTLRRKMAPQMNGGMRVWQSSHLGGHRFAPNILDLPEGRSWVRPEEDDIDALINHTRPASEMAHLYRGWSGLHHTLRAGSRAGHPRPAGLGLDPAHRVRRSHPQERRRPPRRGPHLLLRRRRPPARLRSRRRADRRRPPNRLRHHRTLRALPPVRPHLHHPPAIAQPLGPKALSLP